jgi:hypothetical protein
MINANYQHLKFKRTYLGGSKEKELEIFMQVQNTDGNGTCDWLEYRRILFPYLEDVLHVNFSRSHTSKKMSFILLGFAFLLGLLHVTALSIMAVILAIGFNALHRYFEYKINETQQSHNLSISIVKRQIKNLTGLDI